MFNRIVFSMLTMTVVVLGVPAFAQNQPATASPASSSGEKTVEDIYLQDSVEAMIIKDAIQSSSLQTREVGLQLIKQAIDNGKKSKEIYEALHDMSLESTRVVTTEGGYGRPKYNFPLLRAKACDYLGLLGTPEAQATLLDVLSVEKEPTVLSSAIYALGLIKNNDSDKVTQQAARVFKSFHYTRPDDNMAMAMLLMMEKLGDSGQIKDPDAIEAVRLIMEGIYNPVVKAKAQSIYYKKILAASKNGSTQTPKK